MKLRGVGGLLLALAFFGCDDEPTAQDGGREDFGTVDGGGGAGGGAGGAGGAVETEVRTRLSYIKAKTPRDGVARQDLFIYDFVDKEEFNLTADGGVDCNVKTCQVNGDMSWVGWLERGEGVGFELWLAPVDVTRKLVRQADKRRVSDDVNAFEFARANDTNMVVYSKGQAMGIEQTVEVYVEPVSGATDACDPIDNPTQCQTIVGTINGDGGFRVTPFGSLVILIKTTLSTMTLQFYNVTNGINQDLYTFGDQGGTGSQFSGRLPVGLSPDATYMAVFTRTERIWRAQVLEARPAAPDPIQKELFESVNSPNKCQRMMPFNFTEVRFNPVFSPDGDYFYFLANGDCTQEDGGSNREDFDILRFDREMSADPEVITRNVRASHWSNHDIGSFALSADSSILAFTAPRPNNATSRSIWFIDPETGDYDCSGTAKQHTDINGNPRCEFIFDDEDGALVSYRDLKFHEVEVER
jgi:hypothetical protein